MRAYIISIGTETRTPQLPSVLAMYGFEPEFVSAMDGKALSPNELTHLAERDAGRLLYGTSLSATQVGCNISHRRAYEQFLESQDEWALIVEDDAYPLASLSGLRDWVDSHSISAPAVIQCYSAGRINVTKRPPKPVTGDLELQPLRTFPGFAVGYFINRRAAMTAKSSPRVVAARADWPPWAVLVRFWRSVPNVIEHGKPGERPDSTMPGVAANESRGEKVIRWTGLLSAVTFLRLKDHYPQGLRQYYGHAVMPSYLYWRGRLQEVLKRVIHPRGFP